MPKPRKKTNTLKPSVFGNALQRFIDEGIDSGKWTSVHDFEGYAGHEVGKVLRGEHVYLEADTLTDIFDHLYNEGDPHDIRQEEKILFKWKELEEWRKFLDEALTVTLIGEAVKMASRHGKASSQGHRLLESEIIDLIRARFGAIWDANSEAFPAEILAFIGLLKGAQKLHSITSAGASAHSDEQDTQGLEGQKIQAPVIQESFTSDHGSNDWIEFTYAPYGSPFGPGHFTRIRPATFTIGGILIDRPDHFGGSYFLARGKDTPTDFKAMLEIDYPSGLENGETVGIFYWRVTPKVRRRRLASLDEPEVFQCDLEPVPAYVHVLSGCYYGSPPPKAFLEKITKRVVLTMERRGPHVIVLVDGKIVREYEDPDDLGPVRVGIVARLWRKGYVRLHHFRVEAISDRAPTSSSPELTASSSAPPLTLTGSTQTIASIAFSPDSALIASGTVERRIRLWRLSDGASAHVLNEDNAWHCLAFSPDGQILAGGGYGNALRLWRAKDGSVLQTLHEYTHAPPFLYTHSESEVSFSPDGRTLASISTDSRVRLWRVSDGKLVRTLEGHDDFAYTVAFSPDGATIASGSLDSTIRLWRVSDGRLLRILQGHTLAVKLVRFMPDGQTLLSTATDGTVRWWRVSDGSAIRTLGIGNWGEISLSLDGELLATSSPDSPDVQLWKLDEGRRLRNIHLPEAGPPKGRGFSPSPIVFSPDGRWLAVGYYIGYANAIIRLWALH